MTNVHQLQLNRDDFFYDMADGFRMGVEKTWHKLQPVSVSKNIIMHDSELNELEPTNYGITIFYKLVVPLSEFSDSGVTENDFEYEQYRFGFNNANHLGLPFKLLDGRFTNQLTALDMQRVTLAYVTPHDLNTTSLPNSAFAVGESLQNPKQDVGTRYTIPKTDGVRHSFLLGSSYSADITDRVIPVRVNVDKNNGTVSYTVTTDSNCLNVPTDGFNEQSSSHKYLMPLLFHEYGIMINNGESSNSTKPNYTAWICMVLGVTEIQQTN